METNNTVYIWIFNGNDEEASYDKAYRVYLKAMYLESPAPWLVIKKEDEIIHKIYTK
jgi:hypothetical protein